MAIQPTIDACRDRIRTPYYLIDESRLLPNLERIAALRERTGVRSVLALKCFSTPALFDLMRRYLDGTTSSSLYEARLRHERFGKEVHVYGVAFSDDEIVQARPRATKVIFNSVSQLVRHRARVAGVSLGLRVNPVSVTPASTLPIPLGRTRGSASPTFRPSRPLPATCPA